MTVRPAFLRTHLSTLLILLPMALIVLLGWIVLTKKETIPDVTFIDLQDRQITTQDLYGNVTIVHFWATSCATCVREMPELVQTYRKYQKAGLRLIAVAMAYDPPDYVIHFAKTHKLPFVVSLDTRGELGRAFGDIQLTPTTLVVNKQGQIIKRYVGEVDFTALHRLLTQELAA